MLSTDTFDIAADLSQMLSHMNFVPNGKCTRLYLKPIYGRNLQFCSIKIHYAIANYRNFCEKSRTKTFTSLTRLNWIMKAIWRTQTNCTDCIFCFYFQKFAGSFSNDIFWTSLLVWWKILLEKLWVFLSKLFLKIVFVLIWNHFRVHAIRYIWMPLEFSFVKKWTLENFRFSKLIIDSNAF